MGTHPIFESDFDCLTAFRMNRLLSRPALALSRTSVRNGGGHVMNDETIMHWKKISFFFCPVFLAIGYLNKDVRTPEHMIRPAWNQAPWCNMTTAKLPWADGSHAAFFWTHFNSIPTKGYEDGRNDGAEIGHDAH